jgi:hypothetical protein
MPTLCGLHKRERGAMEVCYQYNGIGHVIMELTPSDWAAWFSAIGTVLAAVGAFIIYKRTRSDAKTDIIARRRVLHAMLREHVVAAATFVSEGLDRVGRIDTDIDRSNLHLYMIGFELPDADRLMELQTDLIAFGEEGDEKIAAFIEACRQYHKTQKGWAQYVRDNRELIYDGHGIPVALTAVRYALEHLAATSDQALAAIERFDNP